MNRTFAVKVLYFTSFLLSITIFLLCSLNSVETDPLETLERSANFLSRLNVTCVGSSRKNKIISFSLFGDPTEASWRKRFFVPMLRNRAFAALHYADWNLRIYHNLQEDEIAELSAPNLELCNVSELETGLNTASFDWVNPRVWRLLALLDPAVDFVMFRDTDALMLKREVDAVKEWLDSSKTYHIMRDHSWHYTRILAGMFDIRLHNHRSKIREMAAEVLSKALDCRKGTDQDLLMKIFWETVRGDCIVHDSYFCVNPKMNVKDGSEIRPFPTERVNRTFVGNIVGGIEDTVKVFENCPRDCRPKNHPEWLYC